MRTIGLAALGSGLATGASPAVRATGAAAKAGFGAAGAANPVSGTRLILLGTAGGPVIRQRRSQPANLLVVDGTPYLFDAGYGCLRQLALANHDVYDLAAVFITHHHTDHMIDLASIINFAWTSGRKDPLPIVGPPRTTRIVDAALAYFEEAAQVFEQQLTARTPASALIKAHDVTDLRSVYTDSRISVSAIENTHFQTFNHASNKSFSYRVKSADRTIVFSGDTGPSAALTELARGADVLVSEVIDVAAATEMAIVRNHVDAGLVPTIADHMRREHMPAEDLGRLAASAAVGMVVLSHFVPGDDGEHDVSRYVAGVRKHFRGVVVAGSDLEEF